MTNQPDQYPRIALENYALKRLAAENYPHANHRIKVYECPTCGLTAFKIFIEHHTGSSKKNFRGLIRGSCSQCGSEQELFSFTGQNRQKKRETTIHCPCGSEYLYAGECERAEDSDGMPGFVDEGIADGNEEYAFVHVSLLIREGWSLETQREAAQRMMSVLRETFGDRTESGTISISVDIKEMREGVALTFHNIPDVSRST